MVEPKTVAQIYRDQAARARRLAGRTADRQVAERLLELAQELEDRANRAEQDEK